MRCGPTCLHPQLRAALTRDRTAARPQTLRPRGAGGTRVPTRVAPAVATAAGDGVVCAAPEGKGLATVTYADAPAACRSSPRAHRHAIAIVGNRASDVLDVGWRPVGWSSSMRLLVATLAETSYFAVRACNRAGLCTISNWSHPLLARMRAPTGGRASIVNNASYNGIAKCQLTAQVQAKGQFKV